MTSIGIDFGSTYTMVSVYKDGKPETVMASSILDRYPSVVVYHTKLKKYFCGESASAKIGVENTVVFRGFKMLLCQQVSDAELRKRGYDEVNTPEFITKLFLEYVVRNTVKNLGENSIDTLIIGVPLCWFQKLDTIEARRSLLHICKNLEIVLDGVKVQIKNIKMISEPENASAYTAWNYEQDLKKPLDGQILVIDYGGGTLDTALVEVQHINGGLRIKPQMRSGAGENHSGKLGNAGIAFQEAAARLAITEALGTEVEHNDKEFNKFLQDFEKILITDSDDIEETMKEYMLDHEGLKEELLAEIPYDGKPVMISYYHLWKSYQEEIQPVLQQVLDDTVAGLDVNRISISMVGGFCGFCLVKFQIHQYFNITDLKSDPRMKGMIRAAREREKAIAHGASLISSGVITVCDVANFSIGAYATYNDENSTISRHYAIQCGQEIKYNQVYIARDKEGNPFPVVRGYLEKILLDTDGTGRHPVGLVPKRKFADQLRALESKTRNLAIVVGFSLDENERITVHVYNYDMLNRKMDGKPFGSLRLDTMRNMFGGLLLET